MSPIEAIQARATELGLDMHPLRAAMCSIALADHPRPITPDTFDQIITDWAIA